MTTIPWLHYEHLYALLLQQGFTAKALSQGGELWTHTSGATLPLPALNPNEPVRSYHYGAIRAMLSDYGILTQDAFELALLNARHQQVTSS